MNITLATLAEATEQQVFDQVKNHLLTQNEKSMLRNEHVVKCLYRNSEGLKCAAGCLISDEEYDVLKDSQIRDWKDMNDAPWAKLTSSGCVTDVHCDLIAKLQAIHDGYEPHEWPEKLTSLAKVWRLNP